MDIYLKIFLIDFNTSLEHQQYISEGNGHVESLLLVKPNHNFNQYFAQKGCL